MKTQQETIDEAVEAELCRCVSCLTVPVLVLQLEIEPPLGGWEPLLDSLGIRLVVDHIGRPAIAAVAARRLLSEARRQERLATENRDRLTALVASKHPVVTGGIPVPAGVSADVSAFEIMINHDTEKTR